MTGLTQLLNTAVSNIQSDTHSGIFEAELESRIFQVCWMVYGAQNTKKQVTCMTDILRPLEELHGVSWLLLMS